MASVGRLILSDRRQGWIGSGQNRGIVDGSHGDGRRIGRHTEGRCCTRVGERIDLVTSAARSLIPGPIGHSGAIGIIAIRNETNAVATAQQQSGGIGHHTHVRPTTAGIILPGAVTGV